MRYQVGIGAALVAISLSFSHAHAAGLGPLAPLVPSESVASTGFGGAVAITDDTAFVGAPVAGTSGAVYVFIRNGTAWQPHPTTPKLVGAAGDEFGYSVAVAGTTLLVGAPGRASEAGGLYVFRRNGGVINAWQIDGSAVNGPSIAGDRFGESVALSQTQDTALIGAPYNDASASITDTGAAYAYVRTGVAPNFWVQQGTKRVAPLQSPDTAYVERGHFGTTVAVDGNVALIGVPQQVSASRITGGRVFSFLRTGTTWDAGTELPPIAPFDEDDSFGFSMTFSGNWALIGSPDANSVSVPAAFLGGSVHAFERTGGAWVARQRFESPAPEAEGGFGYAVSLSGARAVISGMGENGFFGRVHLFNRAGVSFQAQPPSRTSPRSSSSSFGRSVAVSATAALIGDDALAPAAFTDSGVAAVAAPVLGARAGLALTALLAACGALLLRRRPSA